MKRRANEKMIRYVYMLHLDNRGKKSPFRGLTKAYYSGQTNNIIRRINEHLRGINSRWINNNFRDARKTLEYVEYVYGTENEAEKREKQLKAKNRPQKDKLVYSYKNMLVGYKPCSCIILKKYNGDGEIPLKL